MNKFKKLHPLDKIELSHSQKTILDMMRINAKSQNTKDIMDADLRALKIYLGLGYSVSDAEKAFVKCFELKGGKELYAKRYEIIKNFIKKNEDKK